MNVAIALTVFVLASLALAYTLVGYPIIATFAARLLRNRHPSPPTCHDDYPYPSLSVVICAKNEEQRIGRRVTNLAEVHYPSAPEIVVVCDGCTDGTANAAREAGATVVIEQSSEGGKAACLNTGVAAATGDLVVFTDARQRFHPQALTRLARAFADPRVGAAGGSLEIEGAERRTVGRALDHYWTTEKMLRLAESQIDSTIGCTGAIYTVRRRLYRPIPEDTILDDVLIPMQVALRDYRVVYQPNAIAYDPQPLGGKREHNRKKRTLAGNFQLMFRYPSWLLPWRNRLAVQLVSHKYARVATPLLILLILVSNAVLLPTSIWAVITFSSIVFLLALGAAGLAAPSLNRRSRIIFLASGFLFLQIAICRAFTFYLSWKSQRRTAWR